MAQQTGPKSEPKPQQIGLFYPGDDEDQQEPGSSLRFVPVAVSPETYSAEPTPLEQDCKDMIDALYARNPDPENEGLVAFRLDMPADEALSRLEALAVGTLLRGNEEPIEPPYHYDGTVADLCKSMSQLRGACVTVGRWPSNEDRASGEIEVSFAYSSPHGQWSELVRLHQTSLGDMRVSGSVWVLEYAETGYEDHGARSKTFTEPEVAEFLNFVKDILGSRPTPVPERV